MVTYGEHTACSDITGIIRISASSASTGYIVICGTPYTPVNWLITKQAMRKFMEDMFLKKPLLKDIQIPEEHTKVSNYFHRKKYDAVSLSYEKRKARLHKEE